MRLHREVICIWVWSMGDGWGLMMLFSDACAVLVLIVHCKCKGCSHRHGAHYGNDRRAEARSRVWDKLCSQLPRVQRWDVGWHFMAGPPLVIRRKHPVRKSFELGCNSRGFGVFWVSASSKSYRATVPSSQVLLWWQTEQKCLNWWFSEDLQYPPCKCSTEVLAFIFFIL